MWDVFISYARVDRSYAQQLCEALRGRGVSVWWDWDLVGARISATGSAASSTPRPGWSSSGPRIRWIRRLSSTRRRKPRNRASWCRCRSTAVRLHSASAILHTIAASDIDRCLDQIVAALRANKAPAKKVPQISHGRLGRRPVAAAGVLLLALAGAWAYSGLPVPEGLWKKIVGNERKSRASRLALVIGNQNYRNIAKLRNPLRDVDAVAAALEQRGFTVIKKGDVDAEGLAQAIKTFETTLSVSGGVGLFYYAGNAVNVDGEDILVPVDAVYDSAARTVKGGINLTALQQEIKAESPLAEKDDGMYVIYSASKGQASSDEKPGHHSPFAEAFLEVLQTSADDVVGTYDLIFRKMSLPVVGEADEAVETGPKNFVLIGKRSPKKPPRAQVPYFEKRSATKFVFNDDSYDRHIGVLRILIVDSARDDPMGTKVASR